MDREEAKKVLEEIALNWIHRAYREVTGGEFLEIMPSETPDFIAYDLEGRMIGIELTRLKFPPDDMRARAVMARDEFADDCDATFQLLGLMHAKAAKLKSGSWPKCQRKILFIQLEDSTLERLGPFDIDEADVDGFTEVWLADFTTLAEQDAVFLCPLLHTSGRGLAWTPQEREKPFG